MDLEIPQFLKRSGPAKMPRFPRWKKIKARRPDGDRWRAAGRWEVFIDQDVPRLAVGRRIVWAVEGRKWARLHDGQLQVRIAIAAWLRLKAGGRPVRVVPTSPAATLPP